MRWRSPGSVGDQSRFSENKRSLEEGKADVTRRGRLTLDLTDAKKKKKTFHCLGSNLRRESQQFWIAVNGRYTSLSTHQKKNCEKSGYFIYLSEKHSSKSSWKNYLKSNLTRKDEKCTVILHLNLKYSPLSIIKQTAPACSLLTPGQSLPLVIRQTTHGNVFWQVNCLPLCWYLLS